MTDILLKRYEQYFRHPDHVHDVLGVGDECLACANVRRALGMLGMSTVPEKVEEMYDAPLATAVREFQTTQNHRVADGLVGPGTRQRLTAELLQRFDPSIFARLRRPERWVQRSVFISYARADADRVDKLDQWLRDHGLRTLRDSTFFTAGDTLLENIASALAEADKVLAILSANSRDRDWPRLERELAEQVETTLGARVLIYVRLDNTPLPSHDSTRLAIDSRGSTLRDVGERILHAVRGDSLQPPPFSYDEDRPL